MHPLLACEAARTRRPGLDPYVSAGATALCGTLGGQRPAEGLGALSRDVGDTRAGCLKR
ncbi:hypothetical protein SGLAM104S_04692 [Streptomyces glaucescens]